MRMDGQIGRYDESNSRFSKFSQSACKLLHILMWSLEIILDYVEYNKFLIIRRQKLNQNMLNMYFLSHKKRKSPVLKPVG